MKIEAAKRLMASDLTEDIAYLTKVLKTHPKPTSKGAYVFNYSGGALTYMSNGGFVVLSLKTKLTSRDFMGSGNSLKDALKSMQGSLAEETTIMKTSLARKKQEYEDAAASYSSLVSVMDQLKKI